jgi:hypothetical protein
MKRNLKLMVIPFVIIVAVVAAQVKSNSGRIKETLPAGVNLSEAKLVEIRDNAGQVVLSGTFSNYRADLVSNEPGAKARGLAEIEIEKEGSGLKQEIEVEVENLPALTDFKLIVDGNDIATFATGKAGKRAMKYSRKDSGK